MEKIKFIENLKLKNQESFRKTLPKCERKTEQEEGVVELKLIAVALL